MGPQLLDPASSDSLTEEVERRTENSKTSSTEDGHMVTEFFQQSINFMGQDGKWQPIDNTLVVGGDASTPVRNRANEVGVFLPKNWAAGAARVESKGQFVSFSPKGAHSSASEEGAEGEVVSPSPTASLSPDPTTLTTDPAARLEAPQSSAVQVEGVTATYPGVYNGVDAVYTSTTQGLKEELILAGPDATNLRSR